VAGDTDQHAGSGVGDRSSSAVDRDPVAELAQFYN